MAGKNLNLASFRRGPESAKYLSGDSGLRRNDALVRHPEPQAKDVFSRLEAAPTHISRAWPAPTVFNREQKPAPAILHLQRGFTLVELVAAIVVLGIVAVGLGNIMGNATRGYLDANARSEITAIGRFAVERMSRELRTALPGSIQITNNAGSQCITFRPIVASSRYLTLPVPPLAASSTFTAAVFNTAAMRNGQQYAVAVNALTAANIAAGAVQPLQVANPVSAPDAQSVVTLTLSGAAQFPEHSVQQRFYIIDAPVVFCVNPPPVVNQLPTLTRNGQLLGEFILLQDGGNAVSVFSYNPGSLQRSGVIQIDLRLASPQDVNEVVRFFHQVHIRNVP